MFSDYKEWKITSPVITDIVARKFNSQDGNRFSSLDQMVEFVTSLDASHNGERRPHLVSWNRVQPIVQSLMRLTGMPFHTVLRQSGARKDSRHRFETGKAKLTVPEHASTSANAKDL